jgi:hypothetical protein
MITFPIENCPRCNRKLYCPSPYLGWGWCTSCPMIKFNNGVIRWFEVKNSTQRIEVDTDKYSLLYLKEEKVFGVSAPHDRDFIFKISLNDEDLALSEIELNKLLDQYSIFS